MSFKNQKNNRSSEGGATKNTGQLVKIRGTGYNPPPIDVNNVIFLSMQYVVFS